MGRSADATTGKRLNIFEKACGGMLAAVSDVTRNDIVETCNSKKIVLAFSAAQIAAAFAITVFTVGLVWLVLLVYTAICKNDPDTFVGNIYASLSSGKKTKPKGKGAPRTNKDTRRTQFGSTKKHSPNPCGGDTSELHQPSPTQQTNRPYNAKQNKGKTDPDSDSETLPKEPPVDQSSESSSESAPESEPEPTPAQVSEPLLEESPAAPPPESDSEPIVELLLTEPIAVQSTEPEPELTPAHVPEPLLEEPPAAQSSESDHASDSQLPPSGSVADSLSESPVAEPSPKSQPESDAEVVSAESVAAPEPEAEPELTQEQVSEPLLEEAITAPSSESDPASDSKLLSSGLVAESTPEEPVADSFSESPAAQSSESDSVSVSELPPSGSVAEIALAKSVAASSPESPAAEPGPESQPASDAEVISAESIAAPESEAEVDLTQEQVSEPLLEESPAAPPPESDSEPIVELLLTEPIAVQSTEPEPELTPAQVPELPPGEPPVAQSPKSDSALVPEPLPEEQAAEILSEEPVVTRLPAPDAEVVSAESVVAPTPEDEHEPDAEQAAEAPSSEVIPEALPEEQPAAPPANAEPEPHKSLAAPSKNGFTIDGERNAPSRILDSRPCSCVNVGSDGSYDFFNVQFSDVDTDGAEGEQITRKLIACEANQNPTLAHIISNTDSYVVGGYVRNEDRDMAAAGHTLYGNGGIWECYLMNYANIALQTESAMLIYIFTWPDERPEILPQHLWNPQGISAIEDEAFADKCLSVYQCSSISRTVEDLGASENMSDFTLISAVSGKVVTADNGRKVHLLAVLLEKNDDKSEQRKLIIAVPVSDETPIDRNYHPIVIAAAGRKTIESNVEFADGIRLTRVEAETFGRYKFTCYGLDGKQICQHVIAMHSWDVLDYVYYCITQNEVTFTAITFSEMAKLDEFAFDGIVTFSKCTFSGGTAMAFHSVTTDVRFDRCTFNCEELCFAECKELKRIRITPPDYIDSLPKLSLCPGTDEQIAVEIGGLWSDCDKLNGARAQLLVGEGLNACVFDHNACVVSTGIPANLEQVTFVVVDGGDQFTGANGPGCLRMKFYAGDMRAGDITSDSDGKFSQRAECVAVGNVELNFSFEERFCVEVNLAQFPNVRAVTIFCQWSSIRRLDLSKCKMLEKIEINQSALAIGMVPPPPPPHEFIFPIINLPDKVQPEITLCGNWRSKHVLDEAIESFKRSGATEVQSADEVQFYIGAEGNSNEPLFAIAPPLPYAEDFMENFRLTKLEAYSSVGNNICSTATFTSGTDEVLMASTQTDSELEGTAELDGIVGNDAYEIGGWARYDAYDYPRDIGEDFWQGWSFTCAGEWDGERTERTFYLRVLMKSKHIGPWHLSDPFCVERPIVSIPSDAADLAEFMATPEISHISAKVREFPQCADLSDHEAIAHISGEENILVDEDVPEGADVIAKNKGACKLLVVLFRRKGCTSEDPALMRKLTVNVTRNFADGIDDRTPLAQTVTPLTMAALGEVKRNKDIHAYGAYVSVSSPYDDFYVLVICDSTGIRAHTTIIVVKHGSFAECVKDFKLIEICFSDVTISNAELADITCAFIKFSKCTISKASVELNSHVTDVVFDECTFNGGVGIDLSKCTNLTRAHIAPIAETNLLPPMKLPQAIPEGQMTIEIGGLWTTCEALNGAFDQLRGAHPQGVAVSMDPASVKEEYGRAESTHVKADRVVFGGTDRPYDMIDGKAKLRAKYFSGGRRIGDSHDTYLYGHTCANISEFVVDVGFRGGDAIEKSTAIYSEEDLPMCTSVSLLSAGLFTGTIALWDSVRTFSQMCHAAICIECEYSSKLESIVIAPTYSPFGRRDAARKFAIKATFYQQNRPVATLGGWWYSKRVLEEAMGFFKKKGVPVNLDSPNFYLTNEEDPLRQQPPAEVPST